MIQMSFNLPEIDRVKTKKAVEEVLERYRFFLLQEPSNSLPRVTSSYSLVPPANTNSFHSSTEEAAVRNADLEQSRKKFIKRVGKAINRLNYQERQVIIEYTRSDGQYNYMVYGELGMSERNYYRIKSRAFYKLAFILRIEVYKDRKDDAV